MVAKSYQNMEIVSDVYVSSGRQYVRVRDLKGNEKQVRWYSDKEYARMYGAPVDHSNDPYYKSQKELLGFKEGYITIFKGDTYAVKEELKAAGAHYTRVFGWNIAGGEEIPEIPGIEPVRLDWDKVCKDEESIKSDDALEVIINGLICEPSKSTFQGEVGQRLRQVLMKVTRVFTCDSYYGQSNIHTFEDEEGNVYVWITASKCLNEGSVYWVDGTVKEHKIYKNVPQTILTRCKVTLEVK